MAPLRITQLPQHTKSMHGSAMLPPCASLLEMTMGDLGFVEGAPLQNRIACSMFVGLILAFPHAYTQHWDR